MSKSKTVYDRIDAVFIVHGNAFVYLNWNQPLAEVHLQLQIHNWKPSSQIQSINLGQRRKMCKNLIENGLQNALDRIDRLPFIWLDGQPSGFWSPDWLAGQRLVLFCFFSPPHHMLAVSRSFGYMYSSGRCMDIWRAGMFVYCRTGLLCCLKNTLLPV